MKHFLNAFVISAFFFPQAYSGESLEICATHFSHFDKTLRLQQLKKLIPAIGKKGFVNETQGSYFIIRTEDDKYTGTFITSGLFDLYEIRRDGPVEFCDDGEQLIIKGFGREEPLMLNEEALMLGSTSPKRTFKKGPMPKLLKDLSGILENEVALDN